jgi:hypothetical protein
VIALASSLWWCPSWSSLSSSLVRCCLRRFARSRPRPPALRWASQLRARCGRHARPGGRSTRRRASRAREGQEKEERRAQRQQRAGGGRTSEKPKELLPGPSREIGKKIPLVSIDAEMLRPAKASKSKNKSQKNKEQQVNEEEDVRAMAAAPHRSS